MTQKIMIPAALLLLALVLMAGCSSSHRVVRVEDHPSGKSTLLETVSTEHMALGMYNQSSYQYWECERTDGALNCSKVCWNPDAFGSLPEGVSESDLACTGYAVAADDQ